MADTNSTPFEELNSTTTPLGAGGTWTGQWQLIGRDIRLRFNAVSDQLTSIFVDYSNTPTGDTVLTEPPLGYSFGRNLTEAHIVSPIASYYRLRVVNGDTTQTVLEVYASFVDYNGPRVTPLNKRIGRDEDAIPVRPSDNQDDILRGLRAGVSILNKWGYRDDLDVADGDALIIANNITNTPAILSAASTLTIAFDNATDGSGTTGALSLLFTYIDANQDLQEATVVLGATGINITAFTALNVNRCVVLSSGSANTNAGDISITATSTADVEAFIPASSGTTQQVLAEISRNSVATIKYILLSALRLSGGGGSPRVIFKIHVYSRITETTYEIFRSKMDTDSENSQVISDPIGLKLSAGDIFWVTASTTANDTEVSARVSLNIYAID